MPLITINNENFENEVFKSEKTVLLEFWAAWCGPCKMLAPILDEIEKENPQIKVCKANIDEQSEIASRFEVLSIPTIFIIKNGEITNRSTGLKQKEQILEML